MTYDEDGIRTHVPADYTDYQMEREEDREYAIRAEALAHALSISIPSQRTVETVLADAEKLATFLRGKAA